MDGSRFGGVFGNSLVAGRAGARRLVRAGVILVLAAGSGGRRGCSRIL
ncbi:hypothetical protein HYT04_02260 [Candidatus Kaiserbacteria bacterium]|nr:hypothetical protein [Candidatus Kaiserbacteria bacterium]